MGLGKLLHMLLVFSWYLFSFDSICKEVPVKFPHASETCSFVKVFKLFTLELWVITRIERWPHIKSWSCRRFRLFSALNRKTLWNVVSIETLWNVYLVSFLISSTLLARIRAALADLIFSINFLKYSLETNLSSTCSLLFTWFMLGMPLATQNSFLYLLNVEDFMETWTLLKRKRLRCRLLVSALCNDSLVVIITKWGVEC